jgi:hypothetical protein
MKRYLVILVPLLCSLAFGQGMVVGPNTVIGPNIAVSPGAASGNTFTFVAKSAMAACTTPCATTITSTGSNHLLVVVFGQTAIGSANYITGITSGCSGSWVFPTAAQIHSSSDGSVALAYCLASTSGVTSITITTGSNGYVMVWEVSGSTGSVNFDSCNAAVNSTSSTSQAGPNLTLSGSNDEIVQAFVAGVAHPTAVSTPFGHLTNDVGVANLGAADNENTASGTGPTWTINNSTTGLTSGCAFK